MWQQPHRCRLIPVLFGNRFRQGSWFHLGVSSTGASSELQLWSNGSPDPNLTTPFTHLNSVLGKQRDRRVWVKVEYQVGVLVCHRWGFQIKSLRSKCWVLWVFLVKNHGVLGILRAFLGGNLKQTDGVGPGMGQVLGFFKSGRRQSADLKDTHHKITIPLPVTG